MSIGNITLKNVQNINFKSIISSDTHIKTSPYPSDSVEISNKKEVKNKKLKQLALGLGTAAATLVCATFIFAKRQSNRISKLYNEKLVLSHLPEKIDFKEAKTLEEAIKFAKETLGIKEIDKGFSLEALNTANKGIVDVSNAHKGKLFIPTRLGYKEAKKESTLAYVVRDIESKHFGDLVINKRYFDEQFLNKQIEKGLYSEDKKIFDIYKNGDVQSFYKSGAAYAFPKDGFLDLVEKYYKDKTSLSLSERQTLFYSLLQMQDAASMTHRNPIATLESIIKKLSKVLKANNINIDLTEVKKMTTEKQIEYLENTVSKLESLGAHLTVDCGEANPSSIIYHEMGHLQDYAKNLKELDLKQWRFNLGEIWEQAKHKTRTGEDISRTNIDEVNNHWGSIKDEYFKNLMEKNPKKFQKYYPEFYEFLTNQEIQQTAGKISEYAQSGIGEFIADTYADMVAGKKIPKDVLDLYRKYNGPEFI